MDKEFFEKINKLKIKCYKCLDTKFVWKKRCNDDGLGNFIILTCDYCSNYNFFDYSNKNNLKINGIPIFNVCDNTEDIFLYYSYSNT